MKGGEKKMSKVNEFKKFLVKRFEWETECGIDKDRVKEAHRILKKDYKSIVEILDDVELDAQLRESYLIMFTEGQVKLEGE